MLLHKLVLDIYRWRLKRVQRDDKAATPSVVPRTSDASGWVMSLPSSSPGRGGRLDHEVDDAFEPANTLEDPSLPGSTVAALDDLVDELGDDLPLVVLLAQPG